MRRTYQNDTDTTFGTVQKVITPSNNDLNPIPKALMLLTSGDVTYVPVGNAVATTITAKDLPAGYIIPVRVKRVTSATATIATIEN